MWARLPLPRPCFRIQRSWLRYGRLLPGRQALETVERSQLSRKRSIAGECALCSTPSSTTLDAISGPFGCAEQPGAFVIPGLVCRPRLARSSPLGDPFSYESWNGHYDLVKSTCRTQQCVLTYLTPCASGPMRLKSMVCVWMQPTISRRIFWKRLPPLSEPRQ